MRGLSGCFASGSLTAVVGPNGGGKTTLLRALAGLHRPDAGRIDRGGLRPADLALLPQTSALDRGFPLSCLQVVALGHCGRAGPFRALTGAEWAAARAALGRVDLADLASRSIGSLSAGQFQRVLFARLLVQDAPVLLLDEPFGGLDERTEADLTTLVRGWHAEGRTVVIVSHDLAAVAEWCPETLLLGRGPAAWGPTAQLLGPAERGRARLARGERQVAAASLRRGAA